MNLINPNVLASENIIFDKAIAVQDRVMGSRQQTSFSHVYLISTQNNITARVSCDDGYVFLYYKEPFLKLYISRSANFNINEATNYVANMSFADCLKKLKELSEINNHKPFIFDPAQPLKIYNNNTAAWLLEN